MVARHHNKLYGPSDFKDEENFIKTQRTQLLTVASLGAAVSKHDDSSHDLFEEIVDLVSKTKKKPSPEKWKNRVLWVDDRPENNVYERQAFEEQGLHFKLALSTDEAVETLRNEQFAVIISDMGRKEGPDEGYVLLDELKNSGNDTPFVIYAGSNLPEHKKMARERGAIGSTNRAQELFQLVMGAVQNGS